MVQFKRLLLFFFVPILLCGCQSDESLISRLWLYTYSTGINIPPDTLITPASFLDLRKDKTYTMDFNGFESGTWNIIGHTTLVLTNNRQQVTMIPVKYLAGKILRLDIHNHSLEFEGLPNRTLSSADDPFSPENNFWRIHASAKETDKQITNRLINHFQFWETYFSWALNQHLDYIDVRSTPTPVKIYGNGFGLKPFNQLPATWKSYFYDEEDCRKANDKISQLFSKNAIAWPHTDNKYKMFLSAFQQIKQKVHDTR